jgi:hypothetical protein
MKPLDILCATIDLDRCISLDRGETQALWDACQEQQDRIKRLAELCREFAPHPESISGYSDPDCPDEYKPAIRLACAYYDVPVPVHIGSN